MIEPFLQPSLFSCATAAHPAGLQRPPAHQLWKARYTGQAEGHRVLKAAGQKVSKTKFKDDKGDSNSYGF